MKLCPKCKGLSFYNSYFESYMCSDCENMWREEAEGFKKVEKKLFIKKRKDQSSASSLKMKEAIV